MSKIRNPHLPWSAERLVQHSKTWDFDYGDVGLGRTRHASQRIQDAMQSWRDTHDPEEDPLFDDSLASFHVNDVAALVYECKRLRVLERKILSALGPPSKRMRLDKKLNKLVEDEGAPDDD